MDASREALEHLYSCFDAIYRVLGASAPNSHQRRATSCGPTRARGPSARWRSSSASTSARYPRRRWTPIHATLLEAVADDLSGAMLLYCLVVVVGPRLLVSLRDARALDLDDAARAVLNAASDALVAEMLAAGEVAKTGAPIEDRALAEPSAQGLADRLESSRLRREFRHFPVGCLSPYN